MPVAIGPNSRPERSGERSARAPHCRSSGTDGGDSVSQHRRATGFGTMPDAMRAILARRALARYPLIRAGTERWAARAAGSGSLWTTYRLLTARVSTT